MPSTPDGRLGTVAGSDPNVVLTKHEAAGNDFLVVRGSDLPEPIRPETVVALCDRRRGIGADGVLRLDGVPGHDAVSMELWNADGSVAEMSGNGIRCLAQAAIDAGLATPPRIAVATAAGSRAVDYQVDPDRGEDCAGVEMGVVALGEDLTGTLPDPLRSSPARLVSVGNPHLVIVVDDAEARDAWAVAPAVSRGVAGGVNVELVEAGAGAARGQLRMRVYERGAGETLACGTGSCAAAAVARWRGLCGDAVDVRNPGGILHVALEGVDPAPRARLSGPVRRVARIHLDAGWLLRSEAGHW